MATQFIDRIGIELEGAWQSRPPMPLTSDASVSAQSTISGAECPTPPLTLAQIPQAIRANYPQIVNQTCGMHIHVSFHSAVVYAMLGAQRQPFQAALFRDIRTFAESMTGSDIRTLTSRLEGMDHYCDPRPVDDEHWENQAQARSKVGVRYKALNFCFLLHHTLEIRTLPMMQNAERALQAIFTVLNSVEEFCARHYELPAAPKAVYAPGSGSPVVEPEPVQAGNIEYVIEERGTDERVTTWGVYATRAQAYHRARARLGINLSMVEWTTPENVREAYRITRRATGASARVSRPRAVVVDGGIVGLESLPPVLPPPVRLGAVSIPVTGSAENVRTMIANMMNEREV